MPGLNFNQPGAYFSPTTGYAGSLPMMWALGQYFNELAGPQSTGQAQLAASRASADPAMEFQGAYGATPSAATGGPGQAGSQDAFARLAGGMAGARGTGRQVQSQVRNNALQGVGNVGTAYAGDISSNISAQMALEQARASQNALEFGQISGLVGEGAGLLGGIGGGNIGGMFGNMIGGGSASGAQSGSGGFTPSTPGTFSADSLPPWLKQSDISAYGATGNAPTTANNWFQNLIWGS